MMILYQHGYSALMWAATENQLAVCQLLTEKGANVSHINDVIFYNVLFLLYICYFMLKYISR